MTTPDPDSTFRTRVEAELADFADHQRTHLAQISPGLDELVDAAVEFAAGGKLMRPRFCFGGWLVAGGDPDDPRIIAAAAAFEWLQASALVHDDLMDESDTRRGRPSIHRDFEARHRARDRAGEADAFGARVAILLGDLLLSWADEALRRARPHARTSQIWDRCKSEVIAGQYLDVVAQTHDRLSVAEAMAVVRFKAAKYTVERPVQLGAALAGGDDRLLDDLSNFAIPLGEAFQLRDDLLGVFGDPAATGKPAGDDLREGKRTVLVAEAAKTGDAERLFSLLGTSAGVDEARALVSASGAPERVESMISRLETAADDALAELGPVAQEVLGPLARAATRRDR